LGMLSASIGLPYFLLSTTTPLLQAWFFQRFRSAQPYRLFALSNLGSLLALPAYPLLFEPFLGSTDSAYVWSALYALFAVCCGLTGFYTVRGLSNDAQLAEPAAALSGRPALLPRGHVVSWLLLSSASTCLLLSVTNHLTQNVASVPFLWVLPLALYLITFIICFDRPAWYRRLFFMTLSGAMIILMAFRINSLELIVVAPLFALGLFSACMFCHGELARLRPDPGHLTIYYLCISLGGALGALLVAVLAPVALKGFFELHLVLLFIAVLLVVRSWSYGFVARTSAVVVVLFVAYFDFGAFNATTQGLREIDRNFYGVVRVRDWKRVARVRAMYHGSITHGCQYLDPAKAMEGTCYVSPTSAYGRVMRALEMEGRPRKVGVIGLGAGSLMAYARPGDEWVFYELDPMVVDIAERQFSFQRLSPAKAKYVLGDGRLSLEREAPRGYDLLAIDAFSGDSIPMHLITREAMEVYVKHLRPDGALVFQATNRYVDL
ncbi:MAG TPA: fused MFS/spermidine synthase, partial [Polyangiales bacterium]|nr:fused MFS/spermidine synthase [Polyangiales bacterium]